MSREASPVKAVSLEPQAIDRLFALIREARVGGDFWGERPPLGEITAVVAPRSTAALPALLAALPPAEARHPLILPPGGRWRGTRLAARPGTVDPWPLLAAGVPLHAHGDHDLAALARIAGVALRLTDSGRFGSVDDTAADARRRVAAALLAGADYRDPFSGEATGIEPAIERLALWRSVIDANRDIAAACGMAWWKRAEIARFLWASRARKVRFARSTAKALRVAGRAGGAVAIWPSRVSPELVDRAAKVSVPLVRVEDGFVRSIGLGSNLVPPFSIVVDRRGIHYDPARPSDLEHLLESAAFPPALLERAERLRQFIVARGISKYGAGEAHAFPARDPARRLLLVPGQVEDDMSVLCGGGAVAGNLDLLRRARAREPDAEIWFRPHPDVDAGHRKGAVADGEALSHANRVVRGGGMAPLLDLVDGVHVLTSLTGFEALLRGRAVTTHGVPFYAGGGLSEDLGDVPGRRTRRLTLAELVAGVLVLYPRYLDPVTRLPCQPEDLMARFAGQVRMRSSLLTALRVVQGRLMRDRR